MKLFQDWLEQELIKVTSHPKFGEQVVATSTIVPTLGENNIAGEFDEKVKDLNLLNGLPEQTAYLVTASNGLVYNLANTWIGKINHAPPGLANMFLFGQQLLQYDQHTINEGDSLTFDYGLEYWVFQLTGLEPSEFNHIPAATYIFHEMHFRVVDYSNLIEMNLRQFSKLQILQKIQNYLNSFCKFDHDYIFPKTPNVENFLKKLGKQKQLGIAKKNNKKQKRRQQLKMNENCLNICRAVTIIPITSFEISYIHNAIFGQQPTFAYKKL